jgi:pSer/pThr/pTyr-binding forkhead associated (FHA) protein
VGHAAARAFLCALAGLAAWAVSEPGFSSALGTAEWSRRELLMLLLLGAGVGLAAGLLTGLRRGGRHHAVASSLLGLALGALGGTMGHGPAGAIFTAFGGNPAAGVATNLAPRVLAFLPLGGLIGLAVGASNRALRPTLAGAVGGLVAAFASGATFDLVSAALSPASILAATPGATVETGGPGRALLCGGLGLGIGLFTAIADQASRRAWLRLELGRNEGREWPLDGARTLVGRDERAHVPLFDDPALPPLAAIVERRGGRYFLLDPGTPIGVGHNGVRVPSAELQDGDAVNVGALTLTFRRRGARGSPPPVRAAAPPPATGPQPTVAVRTVPAPSLAVVVATGPMAGTRIVIDRTVEVGREGSGFALPLDQQASRKHCTLSPGPGGIAVADLGSTNGTLVNGVATPSAVLRPGDSLQVGSTVFRVE